MRVALVLKIRRLEKRKSNKLLTATTHKNNNGIAYQNKEKKIQTNLINDGSKERQ